MSYLQWIVEGRKFHVPTLTFIYDLNIAYFLSSLFPSIKSLNAKMFRAFSALCLHSWKITMPIAQIVPLICNTLKELFDYLKVMIHYIKGTQTGKNSIPYKSPKSVKKHVILSSVYPSVYCQCTSSIHVHTSYSSELLREGNSMYQLWPLSMTLT